MSLFYSGYAAYVYYVVTLGSVNLQALVAESQQVEALGSQLGA